MNFVNLKMMALIQDEQGASATEYAVLIVLIILVALGSIYLLGQEVIEAFLAFLAAMTDAKS